MLALDIGVAVRYRCSLDIDVGVRDRCWCYI